MSGREQDELSMTSVTSAPSSSAVGPPGPVDNSDLIQEVQPVAGTPQFRLAHDARGIVNVLQEN